MALVPLAALAALGGAYPSTTLPLLVAAVAAFGVAMPVSIAAPGRRLLDGALIALVAAVALQLTPLPAAVVALISPNAVPLQNRLLLDAGSGVRTLTIDAAATRAGLATLATALLVFWAARDVLGRGGIRTAARAVAAAGLLLAMAGMAQRATAPGTLLWLWTPVDPGATPIGPFVSRNDFGAWLLQAAAIAAGYTVMHVRTHGILDNPSLRLRLRNLLADGTGLMFAGATALMLLALIASLSRGAILGAAASVACGYGLSRRRAARGARAARLGALGLLAVLLLGVYLNIGALVERLVGGAEASRTTIWRETLPAVAHFAVAGTGLGTYAKSMLVYQRTAPEILFNHAHSEYLQLAAEGGLLLTIPVVIAAGAWLALARRRLREDAREVRWVRIGAAAGMTGIALQCVWDATLRMPATAVLFALLAAMVVHEGHRLPAERYEEA